MQTKSAKSGFSTVDPNVIRRRSIVVFVLIYALVLLSSSNSVNAQLSYFDNNVDGDSNIDSIVNIGNDGSTQYQDARSLDGNFQEIMEENVSEVANIEDYVDINSNVDQNQNTGKISNFAFLQDINAADSQFVETGTTQSWGDTSGGSQGLPVNWTRCMSGDFNLGSSYQLNEIHVLTDEADSYARLSVYQGGTLSNPNGADLIWDAGMVKAENGFVGITNGSSTLDNNEPIWICVKGNDATFNSYYTSTYDDTSDFQNTNGRVVLAAHSNDETVPYESTIDSTGMAFGNFWYTFYIVLEDMASDKQLDQELQFTNSIDYLPSETLAIKTGDFTGTEDINVTYWSASNWIPIASALTPNSWNNYSVSITSPTFTIKFGGSTTSSDSIVDIWNIDAVLLVVAGVGDNEIPIQTDTSNVDNIPNIGTIDNFSNLTTTGTQYSNFDEATAKGVIAFQRASGSTGASHSINVGTPGNNRLVAVFVGNESSGTSLGGVTIDGKTAIKLTESDNSEGLGNHQELWILTETGLGSSSGTVTISAIGASSLYALHIMVFYNVRDSLIPYDVQIDNTSLDQVEIVPAPIDVPADGLVIFGAGNGQSGSYLNADWDTSPTAVADDGFSPEIEMIEAHDGSYPNSAVLAEAFWISDISAQTDRQFRASGSITNNRGTGIIASFEPATYQLDQELQWSDIPNNMYSEELAIFTGDLADEDILVDYWNGTNWNNLFLDLTPNSWNNISITDVLNVNTFTIRFSDGIKLLDNGQDNWEIDIVLIAYHSTNTNYRLEWEHQTKEIDDDREKFELTVYGYSSDTSETFGIQMWNTSSSSWTGLLPIEIGSSLDWYNVTISGVGIIGSTITWRYVGNQDQPYDLQQTTLLIDYVGIATYNEAPIFSDVPQDIVISEGTYGNIISWGAYDLNPDYYIVEMNEIGEYELGNWNNSELITINIDGLDKGEYIYTITLHDIYDYTSESTVIVNVIDTTNPIFEVVPDDFSYAEGSLDNTLTWDVFDKWASSYELYQNGILIVADGTWDNENNVTVDIDGLSMGSYNFTLIMKDESDNIASDTIFVMVIDNNSPEIDSTQVEIVYSEGVQGNTLTWNATDNHPDTYTIYRNGTDIGETGNWISATNIFINIDGLQKGSYNYTIVISDTSDNLASFTIMVLVYDGTPPSLVESSGNLAYAHGSNGNFIGWKASDKYPSIYNLTTDGEFIESYFWTDFELILIDVDGLAAGIHNFTITFYDEAGNSLVDSIEVNVVAESVAPVITFSPSDQVIHEGTVGNNVNWTATDEFPLIYRIYINNQNTILNLWRNNIPIVINIDQLDLGINNVTIIIEDLSGNKSKNTVFIKVIDEIEPELIDIPSIMEIIVGSTGNLLVWKANDKHPNTYLIYVNNSVVVSGDWTNNDNVIYNVDHLPLGSYNFFIIFYDSSMNMKTHKVTVKVNFIPTHIEYITYAPSVYEGHFDNITGLWVDENNIGVPIGFVKSALYNADNIGAIVREINTLSIDGQFRLNFDYTLITPGNYILVLQFVQASYQNRTLLFDITVLAHQVEISLNFNGDLIPNSNYSVIVQVTYKDPLTGGLILSQAGFKTGAAAGIIVNLNLELEFRNGSRTILYYELMTDSNGLALAVITAAYTKHLSKINDVSAKVASQGAIAANAYKAEASELPEIISISNDPISTVNLPIIGPVNRSLAIALFVMISTLIVTLILFKYREQKEIQLVRLTEDLEIAEKELRGIKSVQQIILITQSGLPVYVKQIQSVGLDPLLLSGMSTAISSFLQEVSSQESLGVQVMENQGLSITAHKTHLSSFIVISASSLPPTILGQIILTHTMIEEKFAIKLQQKFPGQIDPSEIEAIFNKNALKVVLLNKLRVDSKKQKEFTNTRFEDKEMKDLISLYIDSISSEEVVITLDGIMNFYRSVDVPFNKIARIVLTIYDLQLLTNAINQ